jgi:hypothetical protein
MLRAALLVGDPLADAWLEWTERPDEPPGSALFEAALARGIDAIAAPPEPLRALFRQLEATPRWLDREVLLLGTRTILRVGRRGMYALASASLMSGYLSSGAVKPLVATGALTRMARRRLAETAKFVRDIGASGALGRSSEGFRTSVRVRMMHAHVRRVLSRSPEWRTEDWGTPINQSDMVGTLLEFSVVYILGLAVLGHVISRREREAVMHVWRYVGYLLGTREDLLPASFAEALELIQILNLTEAGPDEDSRRLAEALVGAWQEGRPNAPRWVSMLIGRFLSGYSRLLLGRRASDALGLPDDVFRFAPLLFAPAALSAEAFARLSPSLLERAIRSGREAIEADLEAALEGRPARFGHPVSARAG